MSARVRGALKLPSLDSVVNWGTDGAIVVEDGVILEADALAAALLGGEGGAPLVGRRLEDFVRIEDLKAVTACLEALAVGEEVRHTVRLAPAAGRTTEVEVRATRRVDRRLLLLIAGAPAPSARDVLDTLCDVLLHAETGQAFLEGFLGTVRSTLRADYAFVAEATAAGDAEMRLRALVGPEGPIRGDACCVDEAITRELRAEEATPLPPSALECLSRFFHVGYEPNWSWAIPLRDDDGAVSGLFGVVSRDEPRLDQTVSESLDLVAPRVATEISRLRAEAALRRSERRLRAMVQASTSFVWSVDADGNPTLHSKRTWARVSGQETEPEESNDSWLKAVVPEDRDRVASTWKAAFAARREHELSYRVHAPDGSVRHLKVRAVPVLDEDGVFEGFIGTIEDVSELRRVADELAFRNDTLHFLRVVPEAASHGAEFRECVELVLREGRSVWGFAEAVAYLRPAPSEPFEPLGAGGAGSEASVPEPLSAGALAEVVDGDGPAWLQDRPHVLVPVRAEAGTVAVLHFAKRPSGEPDDVLLDVLSRVARQLAEAYTRERRQEEIRAAQRKAFEAQKLEAVGRLAGGMAHEFNNLLMVILGEADLASTEPDLSPSVMAALDQVRVAGRRAAEMTDQLLSFSGRGQGAPRAIDLGEVVPGVEGIAERVMGDDVTIRADHEVLGDGWLVHAHRGEIEQALLNLLINSRDAGSTEVVIRLRAESVSDAVARQNGVDPGRYLVISVVDDGEGIPPEHIGSVFEPFFTTREASPGLGLASTYGIVSRAGGFIEVDSAVGRGSEFRVFLPAYEPAEPDGASTASDPDPSPPQRGTTVWVLEDDDSVRSITERILSAAGYRVESMATMNELRDRLDGGVARPDILLTDCVLAEGESGRDADALVRALVPGVATVFMSGYTDDVLVQEGRLEPGRCFLAKPFTPEDLLGALARAHSGATGSSRPGEG